MDEQSIRDFFAAVTVGDMDALSAAMTDDVAFEFPGQRFGGRFEGKRKVLLFFKGNSRLFKDGMSFDLSWVGLCGDRAVVQWTNSGQTREGDDYANRGVTILHLRDGLIHEIQDYLDTERVSAAWPAK